MNNNLVKAAKEILHLHLCEQEGISSGQPTREQWLTAVDNLSAALSSHTEQGEEVKSAEEYFKLKSIRVYYADRNDYLTKEDFIAYAAQFKLNTQRNSADEILKDALGKHNYNELDCVRPFILIAMEAYASQFKSSQGEVNEGMKTQCQFHSIELCDLSEADCWIDCNEHIYNIVDPKNRRIIQKPSPQFDAERNRK